MKKVMLMGDSIRGGYQNVVAEVLKDEYSVWGYNENGRFAKYTLNELGRMFESYSNNLKKPQNDLCTTPTIEVSKEIVYPDIIHWNNGLWDTSIVCEEDGPFTPIPEYLDYMYKILRELRKVTNKIIFATTTPVKPDNPNQKNYIITEYNKAIVEMMLREGVVVNDLNALVSQDLDKYLSEDNIHLSDEGKRMCGNAVANCIREISKL